MDNKAEECLRLGDSECLQLREEANRDLIECKNILNVVKEKQTNGKV